MNIANGALISTIGIAINVSMAITAQSMAVRIIGFPQYTLALQRLSMPCRQQGKRSYQVLASSLEAGECRNAAIPAIERPVTAAVFFYRENHFDCHRVHGMYAAIDV
jgi:hypothetical protein